MATLFDAEIPQGWEVETDAQGNSIITAPTTSARFGGGVTIHWQQRKFALGYGVRPRNDAEKFVGRGWKTKLVAAAIRDLSAALTPFILKNKAGSLATAGQVHASLPQVSDPSVTKNRST